MKTKCEVMQKSNPNVLLNIEKTTLFIISLWSPVDTQGPEHTKILKIGERWLSRNTVYQEKRFNRRQKLTLAGNQTFGCQFYTPMELARLIIRLIKYNLISNRLQLLGRPFLLHSGRYFSRIFSP